MGSFFGMDLCTHQLTDFIAESVLYARKSVLLLVVRLHGLLLFLVRFSASYSNYPQI